VTLIRLLVILAYASLVSCGGGDGQPDFDGDGHPDSADCAASDVTAWQSLAFLSRDGDGDSFRIVATGSICSGVTLPGGYFPGSATSANLDCDDSDRTRFTAHAFASRDSDGDSYRINEAGTLCAGAEMPASYYADAVTTGDVDCNDTDGSIWANLSFASYDGDSDSHRVGLSGTICAGAALPAAYSVDSIASPDADCDDADATRWIGVNYLGRDRDVDGHPIDDPGLLCLAVAALPATFVSTVPALMRDCDDADSARWRLVSVYRDQDGDGVGAGAREIQCLGSAAATGFSLKGYDPNDVAADPAAALIADFDLPTTVTTPADEGDDEDIF
jgi:hypothetical protein